MRMQLHTYLEDSLEIQALTVQTSFVSLIISSSCPPFEPDVPYCYAGNSTEVDFSNYRDSTYHVQNVWYFVV